MMKLILDGMTSLFLWPLVHLWQMFDRLMNKIFIWSVSTTIVLIAAFIWVKVFPAPIPAAPPVQIIRPAPVQTPAAAPCQPYYVHC